MENKIEGGQFSLGDELGKFREKRGREEEENRLHMNCQKQPVLTLKDEDDTFVAVSKNPIKRPTAISPALHTFSLPQPISGSQP